jgi:hypothetical protein
LRSTFGVDFEVSKLDHRGMKLVINAFNEISEIDRR